MFTFHKDDVSVFFFFFSMMHVLVSYLKFMIILNILQFIHPLSFNSLQKRSLFATKLFRRLQKAIVKTSFFDGKSLPLTMTRQISTHLWWQNESVENTYYFCWKCDFFLGKCSRLTFYDGIKMFVASKVLFMTTKQKTVETINTCDSFGTSKIQNIFFLWY